MPRIKPEGCKCNDLFTCGVCLTASALAWQAKINASPFAEYWRNYKGPEPCDCVKLRNQGKDSE